MGKASRKTSGTDRAAELRARADAKRQAFADMVPDLPIWDYPDVAHTAPEYHRGLSALLEQQVRVGGHLTTAGYMHPASAAAALGLSAEQFVAANARLHERELMTWNAERRVHEYTAAATKEAVSEAIRSLGDVDEEPSRVDA